jgi:hypothetical protein
MRHALRAGKNREKFAISEAPSENFWTKFSCRIAGEASARETYVF